MHLKLIDDPFRFAVCLFLGGYYTMLKQKNYLHATEQVLHMLPNLKAIVGDNIGHGIRLDNRDLVCCIHLIISQF